MSDETARSPDEEKTPKNLRELTYKLVVIVREALGPGALAELRRLNPEQHGSPAFWRLAVAQLKDGRLYWIGGDSQDEAEKRWAVIFFAMAQCKNLHVPRVSLGQSLAKAGYHEQRFTRLLRSRGSRLLDEVMTAARYLSAKAETFDIGDLAELVASSEQPHTEDFRRNLARQYYSNLD